MPLADACDIGPQCCTTLYDVAAYLLEKSYRALCDCYPEPESCPINSWRKYVTMGSGDDGVDDALTCAFLTGGPATQAARTLSLALYRASFELRLRERGWPTVHADSAGAVHAPDWQEQTGKARQALAHGEKMYRNLVWLNNTRQLPPPEFQCSNALIGPLTPLAPRGGVVGFTVAITMDVPWSGG